MVPCSAANSYRDGPSELSRSSSGYYSTTPDAADPGFPDVNKLRVIVTVNVLFATARASKMRSEGVSWGEKATKEKYCHKIIYQHLDLVSDAEERMNLARGADDAAMEVFSETISENDPASPPCSPRYQAGLRDEIRKDGRSIALTEFTYRILAPTNCSWHFRGSRIDL
jgi:hypothetical protein